MTQHSVVLANSNALILQALADLVEGDRRFTLLGTSKTAEGCLELCLRLAVEICVVEWTIPKLGAEQLLQLLRDHPSAPRSVVYASGNDPNVVRSALAAGAAGFSTSDMPHERLLDIMASVAAGKMVFPYVDIRTLKQDPRESLTDRERTILAELAQGRTNTELARHLGISTNTVKFHLRNLYDKLGLKNRAQAIAFHYRKPEG